jgi:hypothetical protein
MDTAGVALHRERQKQTRTASVSVAPRPTTGAVHRLAGWRRTLCPVCIVGGVVWWVS